MNSQQKNYLYAKAALTAIKKVGENAEQEYIKSRGIKNADGKTPKLIYMIDDEKTFNETNEEFSEAPENKARWQEELKAREVLNAAEAELINYGISIAPRNIRKSLKERAAENYTARKKLLELVIKLDTKTVKGHKNYEN